MVCANLEECVQVRRAAIEFLSMRCGQQVAQQEFKAGDLRQNTLQRGVGSDRVVASERIFGLESHGHQRISDLVRQTRRKTAYGR